MKTGTLSALLLLMTLALSACSAPTTATGNNGTNTGTGSNTGNNTAGIGVSVGVSSGTNATATVQGKTYTEDQVRAAIACMKASNKSNISSTASQHEVILNTAAETGDQAKVSAAMTSVIAGTLVLQSAANLNCL